MPDILEDPCVECPTPFQSVLQRIALPGGASRCRTAELRCGRSKRPLDRAIATINISQRFSYGMSGKCLKRGLETSGEGRPRDRAAMGQRNTKCRMIWLLNGVNPEHLRLIPIGRCTNSGVLPPPERMERAGPSLLMIPRI